MHSVVVLLLTVLSISPRVLSQRRVAVIGGGISGAFTAKYLVDFDTNCDLDVLDLYDPVATLGQFLTKTTTGATTGGDLQGSRVATYKTEDGRVVELGASILSERFQFIREMAASGNLTVGTPFDTGADESSLPSGMAISNGNGDVVLNTANSTSAFHKKVALLHRYNIDLYVVSRAMSKAIDKFSVAQSQLMDPTGFFYDSPYELWKAVGLEYLVQLSLEAYCDSLLVSKGRSVWKPYVGMGTLREELLAAVNLINYNQDNTQINALSGLASFSVASVPFYSIQGGNIQLVSSAFSQAQRNHASNCGEKEGVVNHISQHITTVVGGMDGFQLFGEGGSILGKYDIVVLAAPLSMAQINFLIQSHIDESVLQPMPMGSLVENHEDTTEVPDDHVGNSPLPHPLPESATRPYTQVVTTLVKDAELQLAYLGLSSNQVPRGIHMTPLGKALENNITSIAQVSSVDNLYKIFSSEAIPMEALRKLFGESVQVEYEQAWGGRHGGATPDYHGEGRSTSFLLWDGATGFSGHTAAGALYYPNALELTLACIETSAMGAKAVAKLIAKRMGWLNLPKQGYGIGEEL